MQETEKSVIPGHEVISELDDRLRSRLHIRTVGITGSTNDDLKAAAADGAPEGEVLIAGAQTAGKGRLGRSFWSPDSGGLYMSILLRPSLPIGSALCITAAAAVAVSEAADNISGIRSGIKWVNDIYVDGRKICGILTESAVAPDGSMNHAVLGIGVNTCDMGFPEELRDKAGAIGIDRALIPKLAAGILTRFFAIYDSLPSRAFMEEYRHRSVLTGRVIEYERGGVLYRGTVEGIDNDARLLVRGSDNKVIQLISGEVNIKTRIQAQ